MANPLWVPDLAGSAKVYLVLDVVTTDVVR